MESDDSFVGGFMKTPVKPSFVAPSQPLEKSLKEHIQRTAGLPTQQQDLPHNQLSEKRSSSKKKKEKRKSKDCSPPITTLDHQRTTHSK